MDAMGQVAVIVDGKVKDKGPTKSPKRQKPKASKLLDRFGNPIEG